MVATPSGGGGSESAIATDASNAIVSCNHTTSVVAVRPVERGQARLQA
jgi:hypothetical protein